MMYIVSVMRCGSVLLLILVRVSLVMHVFLSICSCFGASGRRYFVLLAFPGRRHFKVFLYIYVSGI